MESKLIPNYGKNNILTFDCEDFFSLPAFSNYCDKSDKDVLIQKQVQNILDLLDEFHIKATFFVVGEIVKRNPGIAKRIVEKGHQIGSHGQHHVEVYKYIKQEFENDLQDSINEIKKACGIEVNCYRAPFWSFKSSIDWFWDVLAENNIKYDSSIFPISKYLFGNPAAIPIINRQKSGIVELPPSTFRIMKQGFPYSGGIYFRFIPSYILKILIRRSLKRGKPIILYFHPWELDPDLPKISGISLVFKFVLYFNTKRSMKKLRGILEEFSFTSIDGYFNA